MSDVWLHPCYRCHPWSGAFRHGFMFSRVGGPRIHLIIFQRLAIAALLFCVAPVNAAVTPASLFQDHMILQHRHGGADLGRRGRGNQGHGRIRRSTPRDRGHRGWPLAGQAQSLEGHAIPGEATITGTNRVVIHDVLVGDVWLASGQSNMTMCFDPAFYPAEAAAADQPEIRIANVGPAARCAPG